MSEPISNQPEALSVSELSQKLKRTLEQQFDFVRIRGELSRVKIHTSGHLYTDLKDENAVINAVCWRGTVSQLSIKPEEGLEVICTGKITTYPARSNYQLVIESMELAGQGALLKMLEERKKKLQAEGLFDPARKRALPFLPETIGIITSPTGAVIQDMLHRLGDRFPRRILLWPAAVQGENTVRDVIAGIKAFHALPAGQRPDVLIVARGGGSLEDLMSFNDEAIVRAIAASEIPTIAAIGHETDVTLIELAADRRAPTPSAAAEMAVPVRADLIYTLSSHRQRMENLLHASA
jgi:exodeoxyribonuclease VII large subunit